MPSSSATGPAERRADPAPRASSDHLRFLAALQAATQGLGEPGPLIETTARMLAEHLDADRCAYAEVEDDRTLAITGDHGRGVPSIVGRWELRAFGDAYVATMRAGAPFVVDDCDADPRIDPAALAAYRAATIRAGITVPLHKAGRFTAVMAVHQKRPRHWSDDEVTLVALVADRCWDTLERARVLRARIAADRALAQSRARLEYAARLSGIGFWYNDLPFDEMIWDARVREHFFMPPDVRVTFDTFLDRVHPDDRDRIRRAVEASINREASYDIVYRVVDPGSGAIKWLRALGGPAYAPDGTPLHFDGVTMDVTAQKLDEERLGRLADAALSIHSAGSLDNVLRAITEEARNIVGAHMGVSSLSTGDDCAQTINAVSLSDKYARYRSYDQKTTNRGIYTEVLRTNRPMRLTQAQLEAHPAWRNYSGERGRHPKLRGWLGVPFVASDGANLGMIQLSDKYDGEFTAADEAVLIQLAQLASVAIENARLYDQLREQDRNKDEFLATLAHELRNPLAPIRTGLHLLQLSPDRSAKVLPMMERQLAHLVRMVDDLLDISRVTRGKITLEQQRVDLRSVLDSALETARPLVEAGGHELAIRLPSEPSPLDVDPTRMSQVFANLLNNAAKYTPRGGRITITATAAGSQLEVAVSDTGTGIPEDMLPRVFDMFTQVNRSLDSSQGGLGIGLTLVRRLVEMHGGTVEAASAGIGQGSTFTVRIPLALPADAPASGASAAAPVPTSSALRVLVVDDNVDAAETLAMLLEVGGNQTRLAHSGTDALAAAAEFAPDIVFLDIGLPEMDGYEVATRLRADHSLRQPVLVALTGWGSEDDRRHAHAAGFDRHLVKPIDSAKLDEVLTSARG